MVFIKKIYIFQILLIAALEQIPRQAHRVHTRCRRASLLTDLQLLKIINYMQLITKGK